MTYSAIPSLVLLFIISFLGFYHHDKILYVISGLAWLVYGITYWDTSNVFSIVMVVVGVAVFVKAFIDKEGKKE